MIHEAIQFGCSKFRLAWLIAQKISNFPRLTLEQILLTLDLRNVDPGSCLCKKSWLILYFWFVVLLMALLTLNNSYNFTLTQLVTPGQVKGSHYDRNISLHIRITLEVWLWRIIFKLKVNTRVDLKTRSHFNLKILLHSRIHPCMGVTAELFRNEILIDILLSVLPAHEW